METNLTTWGEGKQGVAPRPDRFGLFLLGAAFATAPLEIWSIVIVASHGLTLSHIVAVSLSLLAVIRMRRIPLTAGFALYCVLTVVAWGVIAAFLQASGVPSLSRTVRNAVLFLLMFGAFAGASTVRLNGIARSLGARIAGSSFVLVVVYAVYQAFARRNLWPLAFLPMTNPTYKTDPFREGLQHGITAAQYGWGDYFVRASATFAEPSYLGRYLAYAFAISLAMIPLRGRYGRWGVAGLVLCTVGLIVNYSLNGLLSYAVVAAALALPLLRQVRFRVFARLAVVIAALVGTSLVFAPSIGRNVTERLAVLSVSQSSGRFEALPLVLEVVREKPWGAGLAGVSFGNDVHNGFMLFALQFGFVGALVPLVWIGGVAASFFILLVRRQIPLFPRAALTASTGFLAAQLAGWMGGGEMHFPFTWIMSGIAFGTLGRVFERSRPVPVAQHPTRSSPVMAVQKVSV
jgi:hypothetical protein